MNDNLESWTIYERPDDFPHHYVARKFIWAKPTEEVHVADSLREVRRILPPGLNRLPRNPMDDRAIVEIWI